MSCRNKITHKPLQKAIISFLTHIITGDGNLRVAPVVVANTGRSCVQRRQYIRSCGSPFLSDIPRALGRASEKDHHGPF